MLLQLSVSRSLFTAAVLTMALLTSACGGGKDTGNGAEIQIRDLEQADGTINDAMTDLDGVQSEGTALADTGGNRSAAVKNNSAQNATAATPAKDDDTEVVADQ